MPHALHELAHRYFAYLDAHDLDGFVTLFAPTARFHGFGPQPIDTAGVRQALSQLLSAFPDARHSIATIVAEADRVAVYHHFSGTHRAPFQGVPATGKHVVVPGLVTLHVDAAGRIAEAWLNAEMFGLLLQIGAIPSL